MTAISQREARRLKKRVATLDYALEAQRRTWAADYINGVEIGRVEWDASALIPVAIRTARKLQHAVVCIADDSGCVRFIALPHPKVAKE